MVRPRKWERSTCDMFDEYIPWTMGLSNSLENPGRRGVVLLRVDAFQVWANTCFFLLLCHWHLVSGFR